MFAAKMRILTRFRRLTLRYAASMALGLAVILAVPVASSLIFATPAAAETLDGARAKGLIGERPDGYVGIVSGNAGADIQKLVQDVNEQRRTKYEQIAKQKGVPVEQIGAITAEKIIQEKLQPGWYFMDSGGKWIKK
ncbi:YdbL family protein [Dongia soli]|uniref:YdbL family protein n=1 Tax=Dongia soli TaxID=600628 RepID=A0ABU5E9P4_9PROT|nr:YdbL family protein [Dongia soli]MDY0882504.1 YdbL family protein [Dongia soli]